MCYTTAAPATLAKNGASLFFRVEYLYVVCLLNTFFRQIKSFLRFPMYVSVSKKKNHTS